MKKITINFFSFLIFILSISLAFGQQKLKKEGNPQQFGRQIQVSSQERTPSGHIRCYATEYEESLRTKFPNRQSTEEFEQWLAPLVEQIKRDQANGRGVQAIYNIPVVIHIIHNGDCLGTGENITDAQAISQINVLNQDFRRIAGTPGGANTTGLAVDVEINFILAKRDPSGNPTNGINRVQTSIASYDNAAVETEKANTIWDPTKYLNMWTFRFGGDLDGVLGYAQFPTGSGLNGIPAGTTTAETDGVVASYDAFGTNAENDGSFILNPTYNLGRTMTHEVGHWLGLRHIWGDNTTCPPTNNNTSEDFCADTPAALDPNFGCPAGTNSCPSNPGNDMIQNYMDYTDDYCMDTFTSDQKTRMVAVMTNSPRRNTLNASNGATAPSAGIYFNQGANKCEYAETTNCNFTDVTYALSIIKAPTANAVVTFNINGATTATNNVDFQILTPTVTFNSGSTANQNLIIRYFNDGITEATENVVIGMTINANGGDGSIIVAKSLLSVSIIDNDVAPSATFNSTVLSETFDPPTVLTGIKDLDGDGNNWGVSAPGASSTPIGYTTNYAFSRSWDGTNGLNPDNILYTPTAFTIPTGSTNLSFGIGTFQGGAFYLERYSVYLTTVNPSTFTTATLNAQTAVINNAVLAAPAERNTINVDVSSYGGQTVYLVFRHYNTFDMNLIMLDDILITKASSTAVQTEVNTGTSYQATVNAAGTFHAVDNTSGNVMLNGTADNFNYGCTTVLVNRSTTSAGSAAVNYGANTANNLKVMAKTFTVTPTTNNPSGNSSFTFYFTEAEIAAWETATGNNRSLLKAFKAGEATTYSTSIGAFGSNVTLTASTPTGLGGVYYFGIDGTLSNSSFEIVNAITVYPNPTTNELNINLGGDFNTATNYTIYNNLGQTILNKKIGSQADLKVNTSSFSNGVYFITIEREGNTKTLKFIKN
jgi:hypothetical protein